jgi:hypothetical protein
LPSLTDWINRHKTLTVALALLLALLYILHEPYPVDDAYISYRYAQNLVAGNGLVWNPGERVEGYSNFLWTLLMAVGLKLGLALEWWAIIVSLPIQLVALWLAFLLARRLLGSHGWALAALLLVGLNHSAAGFATTGLETPLQLLEFTAVAYLFTIAVAERWTVGRTLLFALILNIALLTRPDSIVLAGAGIAGWFITHKQRTIKDYLSLALPFLLIFIPYLLWKQSYYGTIIPNAFQAKVRGLSGVPWGLYYVYLFLTYYLLAPFFVLVAWQGRRIYREDRRIGLLLVFTAGWVGYVILVGGDFMEFRFFVPILPLLMVAILHAIKRAVADRRLAVALIAGLLLGTANNMLDWSRQFYSYGVERLEGLKCHLYAPDENWVAVGRTLGDLFGGTGITIACGASGAIPYYSRLNTVDFMGLTDKVIPKIAEPFSNMPGHRIIAPLDYLVQRDVNLIVEPINFTLSNTEYGSWLRQASWMDIYGFFMDVDKPAGGRLIDEAFLIAIPYAEGHTFLVWYLTPHPEVERVIRERGLQRIKLTRD